MLNLKKGEKISEIKPLQNGDFAYAVDDKRFILATEVKRWNGSFGAPYGVAKETTITKGQFEALSL